MAAPKGNRNAAKAKEWEAAIRHALNNYETSSIKRGLALREIAKNVVQAALQGEWRAIEEIGNRLDGKAPQSVDVSGEVTQRHVSDLSDEQLANIAAGSSTGTAKAKSRTANDSSIH